MIDSNTDSPTVQERVLAALLLTFAALAMIGMRSWTLAALGCVLSLAARTLGRAGMPPLAAMTPAAVWLVGTIALHIVIIREQFPMALISTTVLALGSFVVTGFWAVHRYERNRAESNPLRSRVRASVQVGLIIGAGFSVIAAVIFVFAAGVESRESDLSANRLPVLVLAYITAGIVGGAIAGSLRPLAEWPLGRMALGVPVAAVAYGCVGAALYSMKLSNGPESWMEVVGTALGIGAIAGPMGALMLHTGMLRLTGEAASYSRRRR